MASEVKAIPNCDDFIPKQEKIVGTDKWRDHFSTCWISFLVFQSLHVHSLSLFCDSVTHSICLMCILVSLHVWQWSIHHYGSSYMHAFIFIMHARPYLKCASFLWFINLVKLRHSSITPSVFVLLCCVWLLPIQDQLCSLDDDDDDDDDNDDDVEKKCIKLFLERENHTIYLLFDWKVLS